MLRWCAVAACICSRTNGYPIGLRSHGKTWRSRSSFSVASSGSARSAVSGSRSLPSAVVAAATSSVGLRGVLSSPALWCPVRSTHARTLWGCYLAANLSFWMFAFGARALDVRMPHLKKTQGKKSYMAQTTWRHALKVAATNMIFFAALAVPAGAAVFRRIHARRPASFASRGTCLTWSLRRRRRSRMPLPSWYDERRCASSEAI